MRYGAPIWPGDRNIWENIAMYYAAGFNYIEVSLDYPWAWSVDSNVLDLLRKAMREFGIKIAIHAPWRDVPYAGVYGELRMLVRRILDVVKKYAEQLEALYIVFHITSQEAYKIPSVKKAVEKSALESLGMILKVLEGYNVCVENLPAGFGSSIEDLELLVREYRESCFCFDIGHAILSGLGRLCTINELSHCITAWIEALGRYMYVAHVHDITNYNGIVHDHVMPGGGIINWEETCRILARIPVKYVMIEMFLTGDLRRPLSSHYSRALDLVSKCWHSGG